MKKVILFTMLLCGTAAMAQNKLPENLKGNWIDVKTGEWEYGFFDDFAIAASEFWDYESVGNERIVLQRDGVEMTLEIKPTKNGWEISRDGEKARRFEKGVPHYTDKDTREFHEPDFMDGAAVLRGVVRTSKALTVSRLDIVSDRDVEQKVQLDPEGRFELTIPLFGAQEVWLNWGESGKQFVLQPGDNQLVFIDGGSIISMGKGARLNNELAQYDEPAFAKTPFQEGLNGVRGMDYLRLAEQQYDQKMAHYHEYIKEHPNVSEQFKFYQTNRMRFGLVEQLMQHRWQLMNGEQFSDGYMEYVNAHMTFDEPRVYALLGDFKTFLRDYQGYLADNAQPAGGIEEMMKGVVGILESEGKMTPEIGTHLATAMEFAHGKSYEGEMPVAELQKLKEAGDFLNNNEDFTDAALRFTEKGVTDSERRISDSLFAARPILQQMLLATKYYREIEAARMPFTAERFAQVNEEIHNAYLRERLHTINDYFADLRNRDVEHPESLRDASELAGIDNPEELFARIIEPLKGKVVFIDIWGTWCGPCREAMKLMPEIKRRYADKDVVFLYLANRSSDEGWRSYIKETHLTGANVVHYNLPRGQQSMLEKHFNVHKWPTYILVNRAGTVLNTDAPSPLTGVEQVIEAIDGALR